MVAEKTPKKAYFIKTAKRKRHRKDYLDPWSLQLQWNRTRMSHMPLILAENRPDRNWRYVQREL